MIDESNLFAAFIKILKKHDKRTGSNIRAEFVQHILLQEDSFVFTKELNDYCSICLSLVGQFSEPPTARRPPAAAGTTFLIRARGGPLLVPAPTVADSGEEPVNDTSDCESSTETRPNPLRRRPLVRSPYARPAWSPAECVYLRAATAAVAAGIMVSTTVGSTHNCHSMYPPNVWNHKLVCMYWWNTKSRGAALLWTWTNFPTFWNSSSLGLHLHFTAKTFYGIHVCFFFLCYDTCVFYFVSSE